MVAWENSMKEAISRMAKNHQKMDGHIKRMDELLEESRSPRITQYINRGSADNLIRLIRAANDHEVITTETGNTVFIMNDDGDHPS